MSWADVDWEQLQRAAVALERIAAALEKLQHDGIIVWGGKEQEEN